MKSSERVRRGFTVFELLLAIVAISLLAAVTIPAFFSRPEVSLENASILFAHDLRAAQNHAAFRGEETRFCFLPGGDGYRVTDTLGQVVTNPATGHAFERAYSADGVFHGIVIQRVDAGPDGVLTIDGRGYPSESAEITLALGEDSRTLLVEGGTGRVKILGSTSGWVDHEE